MKALGHILLVLVFLFCSACVCASILLPEAYVGTASIDGVYAPKDTVIAVKSHDTGEVVGHGFVADDRGLSKIEVFFDNDFEAGVDEGANTGESLDFYLGDCLASVPAPGSVRAEPGGVHKDFVLESGSKSCGKVSAVSSASSNAVAIVGGLVAAVLFFELVFISVRKITK